MSTISDINSLKPVGKGDVAIYQPYYAKSKHDVLPYAISLYRQGALEGQREIENSENIDFVASWFVSKLPSELTRCQVQFNGQADLSYEVTMSNSEFIDYLIEIIINYNNDQTTDFPREFYRKLLRQ